MHYVHQPHLFVVDELRQAWEAQSKPGVVHHPAMFVPLIRAFVDTFRVLHTFRCVWFCIVHLFQRIFSAQQCVFTGVAAEMGKPLGPISSCCSSFCPISLLRCALLILSR